MSELAQERELALRQVPTYTGHLGGSFLELASVRNWPNRGSVDVNLLAEYRPFTWASGSFGYWN